MGNHQYWVDTLYMAAPLLSALGQAAESARQIDIFTRRLQDPATGLYYHMYDWDKQTRTPALWGRGNGWVLMSIADTLEKLDENNPLYVRLQQIALKQLAGLVATQDANGMWHTVLDDPKSYPETSATAMFVYGIRKLIRLNAIPESYERISRRAWSGINEQYVKNGLVTGVSAGTVPKESDYYRNLPLGTETWGTGAYLMAGSEVAR
jgi:unsaturated rhamnogalacturonyl hydrolase